MTIKQKLGLFVFRHDLRLTDNPALSAIAKQCDHLLCVYIIEDEWFETNQFGCQSMGSHRATFLAETLEDLNQNLKGSGQSLHVINGPFLPSLHLLIDKVQPEVFGLNRHCGVNESSALDSLLAFCEDKNIATQIQSEPHLLETQKLPFSIADMPDVFSPFRRKVEKQPLLRGSITKPDTLPPKLNNFEYVFDTDRLTAKSLQLEGGNRDLRLKGGESAANTQLNYYLFETDLITNYKQTRNQLDGWDFSSKLSAWLANGSISPATIAEQIDRYEQVRVANDSTYWLIFELLWREFFHLQAIKQGHHLFAFGGIQNRKPNTDYRHDEFKQWCDGRTGYPIVDACMRQLNATGFMSNRGRQLVASCFVHELNLDWRYGAAYFEQQLVDYDVASNLGNWQYLAGVGTDPRGHRQFNLIKQTEIYDPSGEFIRSWIQD